MEAIRENMPYGPSAIKEKIRILTEGNKWCYLNSQAMTRLREAANDAEEISNLVKIYLESTMILAGPHTADWWRIYAMEGEIFFRESPSPESVVFLTA